MLLRKFLLRCFPLLVALSVPFSAVYLYSQYILDEEKNVVIEKKVTPKEKKDKPGTKKIILEPKKAAIKPKKTTIDEKKKVEDEVEVERKIRRPLQEDSVDVILRRTFFKGKYGAAVKELQNIASRSDNKMEVSKASLFIARSYIEMGNYKKALEVLISSDVKKYFPKDMNFWEEFVLMRIKNH
jgi:hypothetical protein